MKTITATELARNLRQVLDRLAAGAEVDHQFTKIAVVLDRSANQRRASKRQERFTDDQYRPFGGVDVFAGEERVNAG